MLGLVVFVLGFVALFVLSLFFPAVPPGTLLFDLFGHQDSGGLVFGFSESTVFGALVNGLVWAVVLALVYAYRKGPAKQTVDFPLWVPTFTRSGSSVGGPEQSKQFEEPILQRRGYTQGIETVDGIGFVHARKLRYVGVSTVDDLLQVGYTKTGREYLAKHVGVPAATIQSWVNVAKNDV
jgi:hypothetical protein